MRIVALIFNFLAALAALYDGKLLVWDIAMSDVRGGHGGVIVVLLSIVVSAAFLALPVWAALVLVKSRPLLSLLAALASLALSAVGFFILASAFTP